MCAKPEEQDPIRHRARAELEANKEWVQASDRIREAMTRGSELSGDEKITLLLDLTVYIGCQRDVGIIDDNPTGNMSMFERDFPSISAFTKEVFSPEELKRTVKTFYSFEVHYRGS